jgi:hypothetical protein
METWAILRKNIVQGPKITRNPHWRVHARLRLLSDPGQSWEIQEFFHDLQAAAAYLEDKLLEQSDEGIDFASIEYMVLS